MKEFLAIVLLGLLVGCTTKDKQSEELTAYIPDDSMVILKLHNPDLFFSNLRNNEFLRNNNSHPLLETIKNHFTLFNYFPHDDPAYLTLTYSKERNLEYTFISRGLEELNTDSLQNKKVETLTTPDRHIKKYTLESQVGFLSRKDSISVFSNSKRLLEASLSKKSAIPASKDFQKALKSASDREPNIFLNHAKIKSLLETWFPEGDLKTLAHFGTWSELDAELTHKGIKLNGITTVGDSVSNSLSLFQEVGTADNLIGEITPSDARGFYSVSFEKFSKLYRNLLSFKEQEEGAVTHQQELLETASEAGLIYLPGGTVFGIRSLDPEAAKIALSAFQEETETFRDVPIFSYPHEESFEILEPLVSTGNHSSFIYLQDFVLFSSDPELLKEIIQAHQNEQVIIAQEDYTNAFESLSTESSILLVANTPEFKKAFSKRLSPDLPNAAADLNVEDFPVAALQLVYQDGFAHMHAVLNKNSAPGKKSTTSQIASVNLGAPLAIQPVFFENHRTNGLDVAVQDTDNILYLISSTGRIYWKKQLEARIIGNIHSVDILRNGRYQLAFTTQNQLHVIDRTGKTVNPFPLNFKDEITQSLAVFDYDKKRDYRFVIVQGKELFMFDNRGKRVRGFTFNKAADEIIQPPKHIRIGRKDYIIIPEDSGKLNILSRTGKTRVPVKEKIDFSENAWFEHKQNFLSANSSGQIIFIDPDGKVKKESTGPSTNLLIHATENLLVRLSENALRINGKDISLDFGLYTAPEVFYINNKYYIGLTDLQAHKVYVFDSQGVLLPGFPVYGTSGIDLGDADGDAKPELTVQGEKESILLYDLQ